MASDNTDCKWQVTHQVMTLMCNTHGAAPLLHGLHAQDNEAPAMVQDQSHGMVTIIHRWPFTVSWLVNRPDTLKCTTNHSSQMDTLPVTAAKSD